MLGEDRGVFDEWYIPECVIERREIGREREREIEREREGSKKWPRQRSKVFKTTCTCSSK